MESTCYRYKKRYSPKDNTTLQLRSGFLSLREYNVELDSSQKDHGKFISRESQNDKFVFRDFPRSDLPLKICLSLFRTVKWTNILHENNPKKGF